jgi:glycerophosphoryl diester phosphodiesterase
MTSRILGLLAVLAASLLAPPPAGAAAPAPAPALAPAQLGTTEPLVIAHRGASGYRPEHTLAAYRLAIQMGADYIEPDLVSTKDGVLVARHENEISGTTDVAEHPEFADRKTTKTIDGAQFTGWFTEDFTLAELKTLRAKERLPEVRPDNTRYDGRFEIPTFTEVLQLVREESKLAHRTIGVAPETKHPTYFDSIGLSLEEPLVRALEQFHLDGKRAAAVLQSFEVDNLKELDGMVGTPIAQLVDASQAARVTPEGLREVSAYADWVAPTKNLVLPRDPVTGATGSPSEVVEMAHAEGLKVVVWTLRDENQFMATNFRLGTDPNAKGDIHAEVTAFLDAGVDALFADYPDSAVDARDDWLL